MHSIFEPAKKSGGFILYLSLERQGTDRGDRRDGTSGPDLAPGVESVWIHRPDWPLSRSEIPTTAITELTGSGK